MALPPKLVFNARCKHIPISQIPADITQPSCSFEMCLRIKPSRWQYWSLMHDILFSLLLTGYVCVSVYYSKVCLVRLFSVLMSFKLKILQFYLRLISYDENVVPSFALRPSAWVWKMCIKISLPLIIMLIISLIGGGAPSINTNLKPHPRLNGFKRESACLCFSPL